MSSLFDRLSDTLGININVPPELMVTLATGPMLVGLLVEKTVTQQLQALGQQSEELFRGDALPILPFPEPSKSAPLQNEG